MKEKATRTTDGFPGNKLFIRLQLGYNAVKILLRVIPTQRMRIMHSDLHIVQCTNTLSLTPFWFGTRWLCCLLWVEYDTKEKGGGGYFSRHLLRLLAVLAPVQSGLVFAHLICNFITRSVTAIVQSPGPQNKVQAQSQKHGVVIIWKW